MSDKLQFVDLLRLGVGYDLRERVGRTANPLGSYIISTTLVE